MTRLSLVLAALGLLATALSCLAGSAPLTLGETLRGAAGADPAVATIVWEIRAPRAAAAWLTGAALGLSGAALQGLLRNPLAGPGVLGVSAFASLGAVVAIYFGLAAAAIWFVPLAAMAFAGLAVLALIALAGRRLDTVRLILVGVGLSSFAGALISLAMNLAPNPFSLSDMVNWMLGSVANRAWPDIGLVAPTLALGAVLTLAAGPSLRALSLGEDVAASLGAAPARARLLVMMGSAALIGASVSLAGAIGFVGVVAPHAVRPLVRHDPAAVLLPSALAGGAALALADLFVRLAPFDQELKLGVAAALIGAPAFIFIAARLSKASR
ncbi:MAG: iron ABC transporter permease [Pseudomonadota bacterium]